MATIKASKAGVRSLGAQSPAQAPSSTAKAAKGPQMQKAPELPGLRPEVIERRLKLGREALHGKEGVEAAREAPKYFRTYEQVKAAMFELAKRFPDFVKVTDIGDTFEKSTGKADRDILSMTLTSPKEGQKTRVLHIAGQHAREIANPEVLMRYALWALENYGKDAEATALLDNHIIDLVPMMNPDGHAVVEKAYTGERGGDLMKRKNTSGNNGAGTDLNRNWPEKNWGTVGASSSPSNDTYRGPSAGSELENKAIVAHLESTKPAFFMDWHSYSELVLYPPEDDRKNVTPDQEHFVRVGKKMASFNGYTPQASIELYPTSGTSQLPYERWKIPSFVVETGRAFHQTDAQFEETYKKNFPVLQYAAAISPDWRKLSAGPEVASVRMSANGKLTAVAKDALTGKSAVAVEVVSSPFAKPGSGKRLTGSDGAFVGEGLKTSPLAKAKELIYVRAQDSEGNWGPAKAVWKAAGSLSATAVRASVAKAGSKIA